MEIMTLGDYVLTPAQKAALPYVLYHLVDPRNEISMYVGKTQDLVERMQAHARGGGGVAELKRVYDHLGAEAILSWNVLQYTVPEAIDFYRAEYDPAHLPLLEAEPNEAKQAQYIEDFMIRKHRPVCNKNKNPLRDMTLVAAYTGQPPQASQPQLIETVPAIQSLDQARASLAG